MFPDFNSHARVGRDLVGGALVLGLQDFNSHARVGRDLQLCVPRLQLPISTHTPAWGVTH